MKSKSWLALAALVASIGTAEATLLVYEGFDYAANTNIHNLGGGGIGFSGPWVSTDGAGSISEIRAPGYTWGAMQVSGNLLNRTATGGTEGNSRPISADLDAESELWFSVLYKADDNTQFAIGGGAFGDGNNSNLQTGPGFGWKHNSGQLSAIIWGANGSVADSGSGVAIDDDGVLLLVCKVEFGAGTEGADVLSLYSVPPTLVLGSPISTAEFSVDESALNTLTMNTNRDPNYDEIRVGTTFADVVPVSAAFSFSLDPADQLNLTAAYPVLAATNSIATEYANSAAGVEIVALNVSGDSNAFTAVTSTPFTNSTPTPATTSFEVAFDASAVNAISNTTGGFSATGAVEVISRNLDDGLMYTNSVVLRGVFSNPPVKFNIDDSLALTLVAPATVVSNDIEVSYVEGRPGYTNVQIVALNLLNETHPGAFTASNPGVIQDPEPSNGVIGVEFDNGVAGLGNKEGASADLEVVWGEVGGTALSTNTVALSAYNYDLENGVIQQVFGVPVTLNSGLGGSYLSMNNFGAYSNQWNNNSNFEQNLSEGCIKLTSSANTRAAFNLVEANTAGSDNFGVVDTHALTNGLYRYEFDYEVLNSEGADELWSFDAFALVDQQEFPPSNNTDRVRLRISSGNNGGVPVLIEDNGIAFAAQHGQGSISGTGDVSRSTGVIYLNVQDDQDALFVMHRSGRCTVRLYDLVLTRVGDYELPVNSSNAVVAARFEDPVVTNAIVVVGGTQTNTNGVNNTWRGTGLSWDNRALKSNANDTSVRATGTIVRRGTAGYDDVGVQDTIALTDGLYELSVELRVVGDFPSNDSVARVEFWALDQDASGTNNYVKWDHSPSNDEYLKPFGDASATLIDSMTYSTNSVDALVLTNLAVEAEQDVAIVFYHKYGPDFVIDEVELLRTGDLPLEGYDAWAEENGLTVGVNDGFEDDPDLDGLNNLMEYALGGDPLVNDAALIAPQTSESGGFFYHVYNERTDDPSLTFTVELNDNLVVGSWGTDGLEPEERGIDDGEFQMVTNSTDTIEAAEFIRLKVDKD